MKMTFAKAGLIAACLLAGFGVTGTANALDDDSSASFAKTSSADDDGSGDWTFATMEKMRAAEADEDDTAAGTKTASNTPTPTTTQMPGTTPTTSNTGAGGTTGGTNVTGVSQAGGTATPVGTVPEPETYAMMALGLVLMGFVARRRKA